MQRVVSTTSVGTSQGNFPENRLSFSEEFDKFFTASPLGGNSEGDANSENSHIDDPGSASELLSGDEGVPPRLFIVDSGASHHIISRWSLSHKERLTQKKASVPMEFRTANGIVIANDVVKVKVRELGIKVEAYVFDKYTPPLLSLGKLCTVNRLKYVWDGPVPYLKTRGKFSRKIYWTPRQNVPLITSSISQEELEGPKFFQLELPGSEPTQQEPLDAMSGEQLQTSPDIGHHPILEGTEESFEEIPQEVVQLPPQDGVGGNFDP